MLGIITGVLFGTKTEPLGEISKLIIQLLKAVAVPLLFVAIVDALAKAHLSGRGFGWLGLVAAINAALAIVIGMLIVNLVQPGQYLGFIRDGITPNAQTVASAASLDWRKIAASLFPESLVEPFLSGNTPAVILTALAMGLALKHLARSEIADDKLGAEALSRLTATALQLFITVIGWVVYFVPLAVFCAVAKAVGKSGLAVAGGLGIFVAVSIGGMLIHMLGTYQAWVLLHPRITLKSFWRAAKDPAAYAFGINSSLATMPMTLQALKQLDVDDEAARLSACVGTNLNNDGILLYEVVAALVLAQVFGQDLSLTQQLYVALVSVAATIGVAGFPEAGIVALTLVLTAINVPTDAIVMLMSVDWVIARTRSANNVLGDMAVATAIDRFLPLRAGRG